MDKLLLATVSSLLILLYTPAKKETTEAYYSKAEVDSIILELSSKITLMEEEIKKAKHSSSSLFKIAPRVDMRPSEELKAALDDYSGPSVLITSLRRCSSKRSLHYTGDAVDFKITDSLVQYLISPEGTQWLQKHNLKFYIEDNSRSRSFNKYYCKEDTKHFCKIIPWASGLHIHLFIDKKHDSKHRKTRYARQAKNRSKQLDSSPRLRDDTRRSSDDYFSGEG